MKNKFLFIFLLIFSKGFSQSSAGVYFGYHYQTLFPREYNLSNLNYLIGYQQSFINKIVLSANFGFSSSSRTFSVGGYNSGIKIEKDVYIDVNTVMKDFYYFNFESKYFINDLDESPLGVYISSNYKLTSLGLTSLVNGINDGNGNNISNTYTKVNRGQRYNTSYLVNSFGLKVGASTGHGLNLYAGADYNLPIKTEDESLSVSIAPNYNSITYNIGLCIGFGLGY